MTRKGMVVAFAGGIWLALAVPGWTAQAGAAEQARADLAAAEQAVRQAQAQGALWTTAQEALEQARAAMARGDYAAATDAARRAAEQAGLGIAQREYPLFMRQRTR